MDDKCPQCGATMTQTGGVWLCPDCPYWQDDNPQDE